MKTTRRVATSASSLQRGVLATLGGLLGFKGTGAPKPAQGAGTGAPKPAQGAGTGAPSAVSLELGCSQRGGKRRNVNDGEHAGLGVFQRTRGKGDVDEDTGDVRIRQGGYGRWVEGRPQNAKNSGEEGTGIAEESAARRQYAAPARPVVAPRSGGVGGLNHEPPLGTRAASASPVGAGTAPDLCIYEAGAGAPHRSPAGCRGDAATVPSQGRAIFPSQAKRRVGGGQAGLTLALRSALARLGRVTFGRPRGPPACARLLLTAAALALTLASLGALTMPVAAQAQPCEGCKPWWNLSDAPRPGNLPVGGTAVNEVDKLTVTGPVKSEVFYLTGEHSKVFAPLPFNAQPGEVQSALETGGLIPPGYGAGNVEVTGGPLATGTGNLSSVATGTGTLKEKSTEVTEINTTKGAFAVGQEISGEGIPALTTITAIEPTGPGTLTLSAAATENATERALQVGSKEITGLATTSSEPFKVGQELSGKGIPAGTTITAIEPAGPGTLTLSHAITEEASAVPLGVLAPYTITFKGGAGGKPSELEVAEGGSKLEQLTAASFTGSHISLQVVDVGDTEVAGEAHPVSIKDVLPAGVEAVTMEGIEGVSFTNPGGNETRPECSPATLTCTFSGIVAPFAVIEVDIGVIVHEGAAGANTLSVSGGEGKICQAAAAGTGKFKDSKCNEEVAEGEPGNFERTLTGPVHGASLTRPVPVTGAGGGTPFGVESWEVRPEEEGGGLDTQAGSHPYQVTFKGQFNQNAQAEPVQLPKEAIGKLPPGLIGDPSAIKTCPLGEFFGNGCPPDTVVGAAMVNVHEPAQFANEKFDEVGTLTLPIVNLEPQHGEPARFGFNLSNIAPVFVDVHIASGEDYGVLAGSTNITQLTGTLGFRLTFWGVPGVPQHNVARELASPTFEGPLKENEPPPFLSLPTQCDSELHTSLIADSWVDPVPHEYEGQPMGTLDGCDHLAFNPSIKVSPDSEEASKPTGLTVDVHVDQSSVLDGTGLAESNVKNITVALPEGVAVNPAGGNGLEACTGNPSAQPGTPGNQAGYLGKREFPLDPGVEALAFTPRIPGSINSLEAGETAPLEPGINFCANASKIATAEIVTPLLPAGEHVKGAVYLASQNANPFGSLLAMYIIAEDPVSGAVVKLPGTVRLSPSGQLVATFENNPQLAFEDAILHFFGGERAPLASPAHCGAYTTNASFTPWSGGEAVQSSSTFNVTKGPNGTPCPGPALPFKPSLTGGMTNVNAGGFSPLTTTIARSDGEQDMQSVALHMPAGLEGLLSSVKLCPESQANEGTCGPESLIGETTVAGGRRRGSGQCDGRQGLHHRKLRGRPVRAVDREPREGGPVRSGARHGQPGPEPGLRLRRRAREDRGEPAHRGTDGHDRLLGAARDPASDRRDPRADPEGQRQRQPRTLHVQPDQLQPAGPDRRDRLQTKARRSPVGAVPGDQLRGVEIHADAEGLHGREGEQNQRREPSLQDRLPERRDRHPVVDEGDEVRDPQAAPGEADDAPESVSGRHVRTNRGACPPASIIGHVLVHTPVLPVPLEGPLYFVSYGGAAFPDAVAVIKGYGLTIESHGNTFINGKTGVTSATFESVPDVPFESIEVTVPQGPFSEFGANLPKGALTSAASIWSMPILFKAQNGPEIHSNVPVGVTGCGKALTRKQKLAAALKACHKKHGKKRAACEKAARRAYGAKKASKKAHR